MTTLAQLKSAIGNTPLAEIHCRYNGKVLRVFAKLEYYNLTGSVKDRMAYYILEQAYATGHLKAGDTIAEATSGNTGIAMCALGAALGHKVIIYMPDWMSLERQQLIASFGAEIRLVSKEENGFLGSIAMADQYAADHPNVFLPHQFDNVNNVLGQYHGLGKELIRDLDRLGLQPHYFVAGVGTGGVIMGVGKAMRELDSTIKVHPLEPAESPTLSTGHKVGSHRIAGISDEFIPSICQLGTLDEVVTVSDGDSILMAQKLAHSGLGVGISSGANFIGALQLAAQSPNAEAVVTTVFSDDNKKYLSTALSRQEPIKPEYIAPNVEILDIKIHR